METKEVRPKIAQFWTDLLAGKKLVAVENQRGRTVGYLVKHPLKKIKAHSNAQVGKTDNHGQKSSKSRRLMVKQSRKINRR